MPNHNYLEPHEELKMANLSYTKSEEKLCKYAYTSWCPNCDRDSPRRRTKSEMSEPCRKKGKDMKGFVPKRLDYEYENMDQEADENDFLYNCRVRSNLCELPTTYISNNCQVTRMSNDYDKKNRDQNYCKPNEEKLHKINMNSKFDDYFDTHKPYNGFHLAKNAEFAKKCKARNSPEPAIKVNSRNFQYFDVKQNEMKVAKTIVPEPKQPHPVSNLLNLQFNPQLERSPIIYDTCTFFDKKYDPSNLRARYTKEIELLRGKLSDMKGVNIAPKPDNAQSVTVLPPIKIIEKPKTVEVPKTAPEARALPKKSVSKVSLKMRKLSSTKLKKVRSKVSSSLTSVSQFSDSDCGDSVEESDEDSTETKESETTMIPFTREITPTTPTQFLQGNGDTGGWSLRCSLFPHIPPYIKFLTHDAVELPKLPSTKRFFKWKSTTLTPLLVKKTLTNTGFKMVRNSNEWIGVWGKQTKSHVFKLLKETQKFNHFPGTFNLGRKDRIWWNIQRLIIKYGQKEFGFIPKTYVLPQDLRILKQDWRHKNGSGNEKWIVKPPASARGIGIKVINRWSQLPKTESVVVQKYISNPYLINGNKFDLRLYVLITSFNPLRIYLYPDGLVRFASAKYVDDVKYLKDVYMHLTNYSINRNSSQYTVNKDANSCNGHKWSITKLWEYFDKKGIDSKMLWQNLQHLVIKTFLSGEFAISRLIEEHVASRYNCYELLGVDVLLDDNLRAWLLEVNISPSLHEASPVDVFVKAPLVQSLLNIAQFHLPPKVAKCEKSPPCYDPRLYTVALTKKERTKHNYYTNIETRNEYLKDILDDLTGDDVRHLTQAEDELAAIGQFERIFPTATTHKYLQFLEPRYYNRLFDAWETQFVTNRSFGIKHLQTLCAQKLHLRVAKTNKATKNLPNMNLEELSINPVKEGQSYTERSQPLQVNIFEDLRPLSAPVPTK